MAAPVATIDVDCPRCDAPITCAVKATPRPTKLGSKTADFNLRITDLADRFAEHYRSAGHLVHYA